MSVNYTLTLLTNRLQLVANAIDAGATNGFLALLDSGGNTLSTLALARPCGVAALGVLTFNGMSLIDPAAAGTGNAALAMVSDGDGNTVISGLTAGTANTNDIVMSPTSFIAAGQVVAITQASITGN
jgi:hypothetical protein